MDDGFLNYLDTLKGMVELLASIDTGIHSTKIAEFTDEQMIISTIKPTEGRQPFETGIKHPWYREAEWIIVEAYDTEEEAKEGHQRWVETMTAPKLPEYLQDCGNSRIIALVQDAYFFPQIRGEG